MAKYLIQRIGRDAAGSVSRVQWYELWPIKTSTVECDVADVVAALRSGDEVRVQIGGVIGQAVVVSVDGTTIVDIAKSRALSLSAVEEFSLG